MTKLNPFIKAGIFTILIVCLSLLVVEQLDNARTGELRKRIDQTMLENTERQVIQHYGQVMATDTVSQCQYLSRLRQKQFDSTYPLAQRIQDYEKSNLINQEYQNIKNSYFLGLMEIYLSGLEHKRACGGEEIPLVFFYTEKTQCPDCTAQNRLLPIIAARCSGVRIYAFASDIELAPVQMMADKYKVLQTPTIIINENVKLTGLQSEESIISGLVSQGARCTGTQPAGSS